MFKKILRLIHLPLDVRASNKIYFSLRFLMQLIIYSLYYYLIRHVYRIAFTDK